MKSILWNIIEIIVNIYQGLLYAFFISSFLTFKRNTNKKIFYLCCGGGQALLITLFNYITIFESFASILYFAELFVFALFMLEGNIVKKIFGCALPLFAGLAISFVLVNFFSTINNLSITEIATTLNSTRFIAVLSTQCLYYLVFRLLLRIFKTNEKAFKLYDWGIITAVMTASISLSAIILQVAINIKDKKVKLYVNLAVCILLCLNILIYHLINSLSKKNEIEKQLELLKMKEHYQRQYLENSKQQFDSLHKTKHDIKNNMIAVSEMIKSEDYSNALQYMKKYTDMLDATQTYIKTENSVVNSIVNYKLSTAASMGIKVSCLSTTCFVGIDDLDLCSLLSNTLDNAVTACLELPEDEARELHVKISCENNANYTFIVRNTFKESILKKNPQLMTIKSDKSNHGYGIQVLKDIARKYDGNVDFYEEYSMFCCRIDLIAKTSATST